MSEQVKILAMKEISNNQSKQSNSEAIASSPEPEFTPIKNLIGSAISAAFSTLAYLFTQMVAVKLATTPLVNTSNLAAKLGVLVRTILLALGAGVTMIFGIIALGLVLLTGQQIIQAITKEIAKKNSLELDTK